MVKRPKISIDFRPCEVDGEWRVEMRRLEDGVSMLAGLSLLADRFPTRAEAVASAAARKAALKQPR